MKKRIFVLFTGIVFFCGGISAGREISGWHLDTEAPDASLVVPGSTAELTVTDMPSASDTPEVSPAAAPPMMAMSLPEANPDGSIIRTLAQQLENNWLLIYQYVYSRIRTEPYLGLIRSPERTLLDGAGSSIEQAHLFSELVRSYAGSQAIGFLQLNSWTVPVQSAMNIDICDLTGDADYTNAFNLLKSGGLVISAPSPLTADSQVTLYRVLTGVQTENGWYYADPSFKKHTSAGEIDFKLSMSYVRSNLLAAAAGSTGAGWVSGLSNSGITNLLNQYAANLLETFHTNGIATEQLWSAGHVIEGQGVIYSGSAPTVTSPQDLQPAFNGQLTFTGGGLSSLTLKTYETAHKKISILFATNGTYKAKIYVDGTLKSTENTGGSYGELFSLTASVVQGGTTNSAAYPLKRGNQYVFCQSFGTGCSGDMSGYISKNITALKQQGLADSSKEVFTESLRYTGQRWMDQTAAATEALSMLTGTRHVMKYQFGIMAGEAEGFYIDVKQQLKFGATFTDRFSFTDMYIGSALEHAVLEQLQPGNAKGVSTIRILKQANTGGMKIYRADSNNWSVIKGSLTNYNNKSEIQSNINQGAVFILPKNGSVTNDEWSGAGYVQHKHNQQLAMKIGGGYDGGYNAWKKPYVPKIQQTYTKPVYIPPIKTYSPPKSSDPVDMQTGAFLFDHTDLTLNGPLPLSLHRSYRSDTAEDDGLGTGWMHSLNIRAAEHSAIDQSFGQRSAEDMVSYLVGASVVQDLLDNESTAKDWAVAALVADWAAEQLTQNAVSIYMGSKVLTFVKQPDGTFTPPPGMTVSLSKTNGVYVMQERNSSSYTFNTSNLLAQIADTDGNALSFAYNAKTNLKTVVSSFGTSLTFSYTGGTQLVSVADNSSPARTVSYQYSSSNGNLTNFVDAAGKNWGIAYSNTNHPHAITSLRDPENNTAIQNFYNDFGQVTNQISATGQSYDLFITDRRSVERDPLGHCTMYLYDDKGRTVQTQRPDGKSRFDRYDDWDRVTNTVSEAGITNVFVYDVNHNLLEKREAVGTPEEIVTGFGYDAQHHLRFVTNAMGTAEQTITEITYTGSHHIDTLTEANGTDDERLTDFDYFSNGLLDKETRVSEPVSRITSYTYDSYGNPDTVTSTDAGTVDTLYDVQGNLREKEIDGITTAYFYDPRGLLTNTVYAAGTPDQISKFRTYWNNGLLKTVTDARNKTEQYFWTPAYKQAGVVYPDTGSTTNLYDEADRLTHTRDARQNWTEFQLDALGRVTNTIGEITTVSAQYDPAGNVTNSAVDPSGLNLWTTTEYDSLNRPLNRQSSIGNQQFFYDPLGRQTNRIDAASKHWNIEYDALGRVRKTLRPSENYEEYGYNALDSRTQFWNAERKPTTFGLDAQGRITAITNAIGKDTSLFYDDKGNLTDRRNAQNELTHYDYNALNRLTNVVHEGQWKASFGYDADGNSTAIRNQEAEVSFAYDEMNRLKISTQSVYSVSSVVQNFYDLNGNRTNILYPGGLSVSYAFDAEDRLIGVIANHTNFTNAFSFEYDGASRLTNIAYPNGVNSVFEYDAESRVVGYSHGNGSSNFVDRSILRDPRGYKTSENIVTGLEPSFPEGEQRMEHNDADQLTVIHQRDTWLGGELNQWYDRSYTYDDNGCLTQEDVSRPEWNTNSAIHEYTTDYGWDFDNRLTSVSGGLPVSATEYIYDASGVRIGRVYNSVTNYFVIDYKAPLKMPLAETDAEGRITRYYIWSSHGLLAHLDVDPNTQAITATHYYHADEQGSTLALTDEKGTVTDEFAYTPYGKCTARTGTTETSYRWLGGLAVRAEGDGLYYMLNRYYSADMRRFISTDKKGIDGGSNLYAYGALNPLAYSDPFGLEAQSFSSRLSAVNAWTAGLAPNLGPIRRGASMVADAFRGMPASGFTFRGDTRAPTEIFNAGFSARGSSKDIFVHALDNTRPPSAYISTSKSADIAAGFSDNIYIVRPRDGLDVNQILGPRSPFPNELEVAIPGRINPSDIRGVTLPNQGMSILNPNWIP